ncbi:MAG TPA: hypothetical protein VKB76_07360, partial [Ktedonobacterales bacterium]|nr:hypothetical protein [Ktedonobacterales bacterium]
MRKSINARLSELTAGSISSVDQVGLIKDAINACGHDMASLGKRSVSAVLGRNPDDLSRELLELRQRGAPASPRKSKRLLLYADPVDHRIRGAPRIFGGAPGRWSSIGAQLHNLARNDAKYPACLIDALLTGKHDEITRFGDPLKVIGQLGRAALCAAPGYELICADFGAIESRVVAWIAGEAWKLDNFKRYDETGDKNLDNYRSVAHRMLKKTTSIADITDAERQLGKCAELACGFSGWTGAWRKIAHDTDVRSDDEVMAIIRSWRHAHPKICEFWDRLMQAARLSIRAKKAFRAMPAPHPEIITDFDGTDLTITLPSNRVINYPNARLTKNDKFEEGPPNIEFFDNARGKWKPARGWRGTFTENVVQGIARDLLAATIIRAETRSMKVVFHCHDELVIEAPIGTIPEQDLLALLIEPPEWAVGLPLGGKVRSGPIYLEAPATAEPSAAQPSIEHASDTDDRENEDHVSED